VNKEARVVLSQEVPDADLKACIEKEGYRVIEK